MSKGRRLLLITHHSSLLLNPHLAQRARRVAPALLDLDEKFEVDAVADQSLDVAPSLRADLLEARAALADDDALLRWALDVDGAVDARQLVRSLLVALGDDRRDVRNLLACDLQNLLAHHLGDQHAQRLVGQLVLPEKLLAFGEVCDELFDEVFELVAGARRQRHDRAPLVLARVPLDERQQTALVFEFVRLVEKQYRGLGRFFDEAEDEAVAVARRGRGVADEADDINAFERAVDGGHHAADKEVAGLGHAARVPADDL